MQNSHQLLLAIDDSEASRKAVAYVADVVRSAPHMRVTLLHVLPHIPTGLLEHGGCDASEDVCPAALELDEQTARWRARREAAAQALIDDARATLESADVASDRITVEFAAPLPEETIGYHVLQAARELGCDTVVVGRAPRSWLKNALHRSPTNALLGREARGLAIWIVT